MNYSENDSPIYIASVIGERLKRIRLNQDMTQAEIANKAWISRRAVLNAEKGDVRLVELIAILGALNMLGNLDQLIPEVSFSPILLLKLKGKVRKKPQVIINELKTGYKDRKARIRLVIYLHDKELDRFEGVPKWYGQT